ncbi:hypothetical protein KP509_17G084900 [Ceratopteris richardii]|nr:hypothetical protein KP509_17G084900 [Ceratopteris richardii]
MGAPDIDPETLKTLNDLDASTHIDIDKYTSLLQACTLSKSLSHTRHVHRHIMAHGGGAHIFLGFLILTTYSKCQAVEDANAWFAEMPCRSICAWNHMIGLHLRCGQSMHAQHLYEQMLQEGMLPDKITYISMISVFTSLNLVDQGKRINARVVANRCERQVAVATSLINHYGKCGDANRALCLFDELPRRDAVTWSALISGYKQNKHGREVLQFFEQMLMEGVLPSKSVFACTLSACTSQVSLCQGKHMHVYVIHTDLEMEFIVSNALVRMYSECGSLKDARELFDILSSKNVDTSNAMLAAYSQHGCLNNAIKLLGEMKHEGFEIDLINYIHLIDVCGRKAALLEGKQMHACIQRSPYRGSVTVGNALVSMYGRCQSLDNAQSVFDEMPERDVISWNAMISAYVQNGVRRQAMQIFHQMQQAGVMPNKVTFICILDAVSSQADFLETRWLQARLQYDEFYSDVVVATSLITMYGKIGDLTGVVNTFDLLPAPNVISWTAMISAYAFNGNEIEALQMYEQMLQHGMVPDVVTFLNVIVSCTSLMALYTGKTMHVRAQYCGSEVDVAVYNGLVNMYGKCGDLHAACNTFNGISACNLASWNVMMSLYAQHGLVDGALFLLEQMHQCEVAPDRITYVTYLSACSHGGLLKEAIGCLLYIDKDDSELKPSLEHYDCVVDLLGRAGHSCEAEAVVKLLPFQPSPLSWMTLLTVCRSLLDIERGICAANHVFEVDPEDHVPYVMLANIYTAVGREEDAERILRLIEDADEFSLEEDGLKVMHGFPEHFINDYAIQY